MPDLHFLLSDASVFLLSPWKPLIIWAAVACWAWLVCMKIQPDATYYQFNLPNWNLAFIFFSGLGIAIMFFGLMFWVSWPVGVLIMFAPVLFYWRHRNQAVPESAKYHIGIKSSPEAKAKKAAKKASKAATLSYIDANKEAVKAPTEKDPANELYTALESVLLPGLENRASRMDLGLGAGGCIVIRTVDTLRTKQDPLDTDMGAKVFNLIRTLSGMNLEETRRQQVGEFQVRSPQGHHKLTVTASGSSKGQLIRIDFNRAQQVRIPYDALGLLKQQREILDPLIPDHNRHGIVLICAPPGQGLTTTGYALLSCHDSYTSNVRSLELETEAMLEGTVQQVWDPTNPQVDYARTLQSMLRRDPDVILVADMKDADTANVASESGMKGPLLYLSMNANNTMDMMTKWVQLVGDINEAAMPLKAMVSQRLLRRLCDNCKVGFVPSDTGRFRLPEGTELYRAGGQVQDRNKVIECPVCKGSGYLGVTGIFEVMPVTEDVRNALCNGDLKAALNAALREKMIRLQDAAMQKAVAGETSIEEISRVLSPAKKKKKPAADKA